MPNFQGLKHQCIKQHGFTLIEVIVALGLLALTVASLAEVRTLAYQHIRVSKQLQIASYRADSHFNRLRDSNLVEGVLYGEYQIQENGLGLPWELNVVALASDALEPQSTALTDKVSAMQLQLTVWYDGEQRHASFETLVLTQPASSGKTSSLVMPLNSEPN